MRDVHTESEVLAFSHANPKAPCAGVDATLTVDMTDDASTALAASFGG